MLALYYLAAAYVLWVLFLAVMSLASVWHELPKFTKGLALPAVVVALVLDVAFNVCASVIFLDLPREWTFSQRLGRYKKQGNWRAKVARWVCSRLLDPFDVSGLHCR